MKKLSIIMLFLSAVVLIVLGIIFSNKLNKQSNSNKVNSDVAYQRIISLSPNITEILFALGIGEKVVGVTRYCNYPPQAKEKPKVGGYLDPNYEAILSLKPDIVVLLPEFEQIKNFLSELRIKYLAVSNKTVSDILTSIDYLGKQFDTKQQAETILADIRLKMSRIRDKTKNSPRPKVLIVIERTMGTGVIEDVYVAGKNTFYDELIQLAGGVNAFEDEKIAYPILSAEGIIHINPDFIIDLVPQLNQTGLSSANLEKDWDSLVQVNAVKNHHVHIMSQDYAAIPGPRFILFLKDLAQIIHPEVDWGIDQGEI
jgi:iron complex transport system substrate-binding protein